MQLLVKKHGPGQVRSLSYDVTKGTTSDMINKQILIYRVFFRRYRLDKDLVWVRSDRHDTGTQSVDLLGRVHVKVRSMTSDDLLPIDLILSTPLGSFLIS